MSRSRTDPLSGCAVSAPRLPGRSDDPYRVTIAGLSPSRTSSTSSIHGRRILKVRGRCPLRPPVFPRNLPSLPPTHSRGPQTSLRFLLPRLFHLQALMGLSSFPPGPQGVRPPLTTTRSPLTRASLRFFSYFTHLSAIGLCAYFWAAGVQTSMYTLRKKYPLRHWPRFFQLLHLWLYATITTFRVFHSHRTHPL